MSIGHATVKVVDAAPALYPDWVACAATLYAPLVEPIVYLRVTWPFEPVDPVTFVIFPVGSVTVTVTLAPLTGLPFELTVTVR
jgi:hypothetical protein